MALNVQMILSENKLVGEKIVTPRLVNQQTLDYDTFCDYLAQGSTVTAADVSAVMKQLEKNIPLILGLNTKIIASPEGLVFRPTVKGSITQSQLKAKLAQRKQDYLDAGDTASAAKIDADRALVAGDLATSDLHACIVIDLPKKWDTRFQQTVTYKRVTKGVAVLSEGEGGGNDDANNNSGGNGGDNANNQPQNRQYTLTVTSANTDQGTVSGGGTYSEGSSVNISATPKAGYQFDQWNDGNTSSVRTINVSKDESFVAQFKVADSTEPGGSGDDAPPVYE